VYVIQFLLCSLIVFVFTVQAERSQCSGVCFQLCISCSITIHSRCLSVILQRLTFLFRRRIFYPLHETVQCWVFLHPFRTHPNAVRCCPVDVGFILNWDSVPLLPSVIALWFNLFPQSKSMMNKDSVLVSSKILWSISSLSVYICCQFHEFGLSIWIYRFVVGSSAHPFEESKYYFINVPIVIFTWTLLKRAKHEKLRTKQYPLDNGRPGSRKPCYIVFSCKLICLRSQHFQKQITGVSNVIPFSLTKTCQSFQRTSVNFYQTLWLHITAKGSSHISDLSFPFLFCC